MAEPEFVWYHVADINPQPWVASQASVGRRGGKSFVNFYKPTQLKNYQEAIHEEFAALNPPIADPDIPLEVHFYFWRELDVAEGVERKVRAHVADATNLQKALEDALQGVLYKNDRQIRSITSTIVSQNADTTPFILVGLRPHPSTTLIWPTLERSSLSQETQLVADNEWPPRTGSF